MKAFPVKWLTPVGASCFVHLVSQVTWRHPQVCLTNCGEFSHYTGQYSVLYWVLAHRWPNVMKGILEGRAAAADIELVPDYCEWVAAVEQEIWPPSTFVSLTPVLMWFRSSGRTSHWELCLYWQQDQLPPTLAALCQEACESEWLFTDLQSSGLL